MATMSKYCKAYPATRLEAFPGWRARTAPLLAVPGRDADPGDAPAAFAVAPVETGTPGASPVTAVPYYFVHDSFVVTASLFVDEGVAFDAVTDEWKRFCAEALGFHVPAPSRE